MCATSDALGRVVGRCLRFAAASTDEIEVGLTSDGMCLQRSAAELGWFVAFDGNEVTAAVKRNEVGNRVQSFLGNVCRGGVSVDGR